MVVNGTSRVISRMMNNRFLNGNRSLENANPARLAHATVSRMVPALTTTLLK